MKNSTLKSGYCNSFSRSKFTKYPVLRWFSKEIGFGTLHLVHLNHGLIARWIESKTRFTPWYLKFSSRPYQTNVLRRKKDQNNLKTVFRFFKELTFICCGLLLFFFSYPRHVWGKMRTECKFLFYFWTFSQKKKCRPSKPWLPLWLTFCFKQRVMVYSACGFRSSRINKNRTDRNVLQSVNQAGPDETKCFSTPFASRPWPIIPEMLDPHGIWPTFNFCKQAMTNNIVFLCVSIVTGTLV